LEITQKLYVTTRQEWRAWLKKHYRIDKEVWLVFYKKKSGKSRLPYSDAIEEALCFGWIDSTAKPIDADCWAQRFTPRKPKSPYSESNLARLRAMAERGKVVKEVLAKAGDLAPAPLKVPPDILEALKASPEAWANFGKLSPSYKRIRIAYVDGVRKRPAEFEKRLRNFVRMTEKNKIIGFGGIEKYY
jgi:uncharacterized protein YdeI (YjbR/CyaY-like superfamily)